MVLWGPLGWCTLKGNLVWGTDEVNQTFNFKSYGTLKQNWHCPWEWRLACSVASGQAYICACPQCTTSFSEWTLPVLSTCRELLFDMYANSPKSGSTAAHWHFTLPNVTKEKSALAHTPPISTSHPLSFSLFSSFLFPLSSLLWSVLPCKPLSWLNELISETLLGGFITA